MTDTENLVLEVLRRIQADVSDLKHGQRDLRDRISSLEQESALMRQDSVGQDRKPPGAR